MLDVIQKRVSVRNYVPDDLSSGMRTRVTQILGSVQPGFFGQTPRFKLIEKSAARSDERVKLGTYGFIKGARYFIAGAVARGENSDVDYGYALEEIVLEMTTLGLGTCWMGGTFSRKDYGKVLKLGEGDYVPAVTPLGHPAPKRGTVERLVRWSAKSDVRLPFEHLFFAQDFSTPLTATESGLFAEVLQGVRQGPSASNKQPWRIVRRDDGWHLFLVRTPGYAKMVKAADMQKIDMGIAMCHFETAAHALKLPGKWHDANPCIAVPELGEYLVSWG
jgi:nitroreductase